MSIQTTHIHLYPGTDQIKVRTHLSLGGAATVELEASSGRDAQNVSIYFHPDTSDDEASEVEAVRLLDALNASLVAARADIIRRMAKRSAREIKETVAP